MLQVLERASHIEAKDVESLTEPDLQLITDALAWAHQSISDIMADPSDNISFPKTSTQTRPSPDEILTVLQDPENLDAPLYVAEDTVTKDVVDSGKPRLTFLFLTPEGGRRLIGRIWFSKQDSNQFEHLMINNFGVEITTSLDVFHRPSTVECQGYQSFQATGPQFTIDGHRQLQPVQSM